MMKNRKRYPKKGPRSPKAKAVVSANAVKHGLRSPKVVIPGLELQEDWDVFLTDSIDALDPKGAIEYALAERVTSLLWRLRRAARAERDSAILAGKLTDEDGNPTLRAIARMMEYYRAQLGFPDHHPDDPQPKPPPPRPSGPQKPRAPAVLPVPLELKNLSQYEYRLSQQMVQAMRELQALQDRRQGRNAPIMRVAVEGIPDRA